MSPAKKTRKKKSPAGGASQLDLLQVGGVVDVAIEDRMEQAFLDYAMSVIVGRALPDARDGLKPVQRRILYTMWETGLRPDRPYRKCASAVGEVMKKYHPHGDTAIYDALVRMAQDFSTRELLVDGHGNFGSIDGDPPAAMRYTEARLSLLAMELLDGIDEDTVDYVPNYDGYEREPVVLPARFPNLLVNGATGIAVGMATNIAPHNLGEVIDACLHLIDKPKATAQQLMRFVPAPDFPTGARIVESDGIRDAMIAGRGAVTLEAVATTEVRSGNLPRIVITEIPYQVNKANLLEKIAGLVQKKEFEAIRDLRDESSRDGMRIVIELKRGEDPARVLERLYRKTDLRTNFNVNCVALVDGAPQTLGIKEALEIYLAHQREVLTRRTEHRLKRAEDRAHILEGLLHALDYLDEVIALIRGSDSAEDAKHGLISDFELSERQAQAVLDMQLRRLAALERAALEDEYQELLEIIEALQAILRSKARLDEVLREELTEIQRIHATPRRSVIVAAGEVTDDEILETGSDVVFEAQDVTVYVTQGAYVKVVPQRRTTPAHKHGHDPLVAVLRATTDHSILLVDRAGNGYRIDLSDVPVQQPRHRGVSVDQLIGTGPDVPLAGAAVLYAGATVLTVSVAGQVKRTDAEEYLTRQRQIQAAGVRDTDEIEFVAAATDDDHLVLAHDQGLVARFPLSEVRTTGRTASGVAGMKLPKGAKLVSATIVEAGSDEGEIATIAGDGTGFRAPLSQYPVQGRGGKGVKAGPDRLLYCGVARDLHLHGDPAAVVRPVDLPVGKRNGKGAPLDAAVGAPVIPEHA